MLSAYDTFLLVSNLYLAAAGIFSTVFASLICLTIVKHIEDRAPAASFFLRLNSTISELEELMAFGFVFFIIFLLFVFYSFMGSPDELFIIIQSLGMLDISVIAHVVYKWYKYNFKRFLWSN